MKALIKFLLVISFILAIQSKPLNYRKVEWAVDCGNTQGFRSNLGFYYQPDNGYSKNTKVADYNLNSELSAATIKYSSDSSLYMTERHADDSFTYDIPITTPGKHVLILKFSELYFKAPRKRVFAIKFGSTRIIDEIDIFAEVGRLAAYDEYIEFELRNNEIYYEDMKCQSAYKGGKLHLVFEKIGIDNPKVDGIILYNGELSDTDYSDIPAMREEWEKKIAEEAKRKEEEKIRKEELKSKRREKKKIRNDEYEDLEDEFEEIPPEESKGIIGKILENPIVIIIGAILASAIIWNTYTEFINPSKKLNIIDEIEVVSKDKVDQDKKKDQKKPKKKQEILIC